MLANSKKSQDFDWQTTLMPYVKQACAPYVIHEAPAEEDIKRNTDLALYPSRISVRIRRYADMFKKNYANEFTIRSNRPSGAETELSKIISGWGDYTFYGFANADCTGLAAWMLGDLNVFRRWFMYQMAKNNGALPGIEQPNPDGSSLFRVFTISELPDNFVIARLTADMSAIADQAVKQSTTVETTTALAGQWTQSERQMWGV